MIALIKTMTVAVCDICGFTEKAKAVGSQYNEEIYGIPDQWGKGSTEGVHLCPSCLKKFNVTYRNKNSTATPSIYEGSVINV